MLADKAKCADKIGLLLGHEGCLTQLCSIAGGCGQCDDTLQQKALLLLQRTAAKPQSINRGGENEKAPLVGAIMGSVQELLGPLLRGLRVRPIRSDCMLALLQLLLSLTGQAPKLLAALLNQDGIVALLGLLASPDTTEQIHEEISKLLRTMSQSPLYGHRVEDDLAIFLPQAVVAVLLSEPSAARDQVHAQNGTFRLGQQRASSPCGPLFSFHHLKC